MINFAKVIYDNYPHNDLLDIDPDQDCKDLKTLYEVVLAQETGDGLFKFIVTEAYEGGMSSDGERLCIGRIIEVLVRALHDFSAIVEALLQTQITSPTRLGEKKDSSPQNQDKE